MIGENMLPRIVVATLFVVAAGLLFFILSTGSEKEMNLATEGAFEIEADKGIDISDNVYTLPDPDLVFKSEFMADQIVTFYPDPPRTLTIVGPPRVVTKTISPTVIIDFSGDKVTYSGDLPVDEAAKIFFNAVLGYIQKEECR